MENMQVRAQKELVLLHRALHKKRLTSTVEWLNARGWISAHHHVSVGGVFFINFTLSCFCSWLVCWSGGWLLYLYTCWICMLYLYVAYVWLYLYVVFVCLVVFWMFLLTLVGSLASSWFFGLFDLYLCIVCVFISLFFVTGYLIKLS